MDDGAVESLALRSHAVPAQDSHLSLTVPLNVSLRPYRHQGLLSRYTVSIRPNELVSSKSMFVGRKKSRAKIYGLKIYGLMTSDHHQGRGGVLPGIREDPGPVRNFQSDSIRTVSSIQVMKTR